MSRSYHLRPRAAARAAPLRLVASVLLLAGCAAGTPNPPGTASGTGTSIDDFPRSRLVATDFVDAMVRLPELAPARTTLYTARPDSRFGELLVGSLQSAGYDLRLGDEATRPTLGYRVLPERSSSDEGALYTFLVDAGPVRLKRTYRVDLAGVRPTSSMMLHGADPSALASGRSPFDAPGDGAADGAALGTVASRERSTPWRTADDGEPADRDDTAGGASGVRVSTDRVAFAGAPPLPPSSAEDAARPGAVADPPRGRNLFETGRSRYADLLARYETLTREVMVFPNDSLRMGPANKRRAREIAAAFDPRRDLVSVIGCSHGRTALDNGNQTLAIGRSYRVKEALMLAGIDADLVLEEGCWAGVAHERLPARGVVVTHKRRSTG